MKIILVLLVIFPQLLFADEIKCYDHGNIIYKGQVKEVSYEEGLFVFKEPKTNKIVFINTDCMVKIKL